MTPMKTVTLEPRATNIIHINSVNQTVVGIYFCVLLNGYMPKIVNRSLLAVTIRLDVVPWCAMAFLILGSELRGIHLVGAF